MTDQEREIRHTAFLTAERISAELEDEGYSREFHTEDVLDIANEHIKEALDHILKWRSGRDNDRS